MLGVVAEMAAQVMGARATALRLLDDASGQLELRAMHNIHDLPPGYATIPLGEALPGKLPQRQAAPRRRRAGRPALPPA